MLSNNLEKSEFFVKKEGCGFEWVRLKAPLTRTQRSTVTRSKRGT